MTNTVINWPAILKYDGEAELTFITNQAAWNNDPDLHSASYVPQDILIDSLGNIYNLASRRNNLVAPEATNRSLSLQEVIELVKAHLSELSSCCVSKFSAQSIKHAIDIVASTAD